MGQRLYKLDEARGITLISMILYHFMWDLKNLAGFELEWFTGVAGDVWQQSICISFILISGFSFGLAKKHLKRSLTVFLFGALITVITVMIMPENRIVFGVLTFLGSAGLIMIPVSAIHMKLEKIVDAWTLNLTLFIGNLLLFIVFYPVNYGTINLLYKQIELPAYLYKGYLATYLGFADRMFYSTDYFSIFPWIFVYYLGFSTYRLLCYRKENGIYGFRIATSLNMRVTECLSKISTKQIAYIGRNTLIIYMLHQPVLYLITVLIMKLN